MEEREQGLLFDCIVFGLKFLIKLICVSLFFALIMLPLAFVHAADVKAETFVDKALGFFDNANPLAKGDSAPPPPEQKPFELPRLYNDDSHYNSNTEPLNPPQKNRP